MQRSFTSMLMGFAGGCITSICILYLFFWARDIEREKKYYNSLLCELGFSLCAVYEPFSLYVKTSTINENPPEYAFFHKDKCLLSVWESTGKKIINYYENGNVILVSEMTENKVSKRLLSPNNQRGQDRYLYSDLDGDGRLDIGLDLQEKKRYSRPSGLSLVEVDWSLSDKGELRGIKGKDPNAD